MRHQDIDGTEAMERLECLGRQAIARKRTLEREYWVFHLWNVCVGYFVDLIIWEL